MRGRTKIVIAALVAAGVYVAFKDDITQIWDAFHIKVVEYPQPKKTVWLEQNVSREQLNWFYHADQGTRTLGIPYEWFVKLEQPTIPWLIFTSVAPFKDPAYLDRFGFIPVPEQKDVLPIGFAHGFLALTDAVQFLYKCSDFYDPADEHGIVWNDPFLKISWGVDAPIVSEKDAKYPTLTQVPLEHLPGHPEK